MTTATQRCHRIDRLAKELVLELKSHAYFDKDFKPARDEAVKTLEKIQTVCRKKTEWY